MTAATFYEYLDRRALAALRFVDATGQRIDTPVAAVADGVVTARKRAGELVVLEGPGLAAHAASFPAPPAAPAIGSVTVLLDIRPAAAEHGARRFALKLPRDPDPGQAQSGASLFRPIEVELLPTPCARPTGLVAALSVTVRRADDQRRIEGALVRLRTAGGRPQARALTDAAGDAMILVAGVPLSSPGPGATVLPDIAADLDAVVDPNLVRFNADDAVGAARIAAAGRGGPLIDPDDIETRLSGAATAAASVRIACGTTRSATISWTPP